MRFKNVAIESIAYELPPNVVTSLALEQRLDPLYRELRLQPGQLEALTGIRERRYWDPGSTMAEGAIKAGRKALSRSVVKPGDLGMLIYAGVCRDNLEPATACAVADGLGLGSGAQVFDVSNACLGVINGIVQIATAIDGGQLRAGLVVSCESARQIVDLTIDRMLADPSMDRFRLSLATLTGGSGAIAVVVCDQSLAPKGHRLLGGVIRNRVHWHQLCRWGPDSGVPGTAPMEMVTDAVGVMEHGVELGVETWYAFLEEMGWGVEQIDRTICHQVGAPHRDYVLKQLGLSPDIDFTTYEFLGNIGTVSLPITAAIAEERDFLERGHRTAFCGIGSGLNCMMLGVEW
ncbi:MAG: 3-oxoacyl-ACP synthase III [Planctomycetes bacterium]|nr:3-oxoacyl-ACP synthase III [Planctomycetota bacterium]